MTRPWIEGKAAIKIFSGNWRIFLGIIMTL